jgi:cation-transporting ATPase 13A1
MAIDFVGCWVVEVICKYLFADLAPKPLVTRGAERRVKRREQQERERQEREIAEAHAELEKKAQ